MIKYINMFHQKSISVPTKYIQEINALLTNPNSKIMQRLFKTINTYGTPAEINKKAKHSSELSVILSKLKKINPVYVNDLHWLIKERDVGSFVSIEEYNRNILGKRYAKIKSWDSWIIW